MPVGNNGQYIAPTFVNNNAPALDADEMNGMAGAAAGAVEYDREQFLSATQKTRGRLNISAAAQADVTALQQTVQQLGSQFTFKGATTSALLPQTGNVVNDTYFVTDLGYNETWNGTEWKQSGSPITVDSNLETAGYAADAQKTGNAIADQYSTTSSYNVGDIVLYEGDLYKCTVAIPVAEAWNAAHWSAMNVAEKISEVETSVTEAYGISTPVGYRRIRCAIVDDTKPYVYATYSSVHSTQNSRFIARVRIPAIGATQRIFGSRTNTSIRGFCSLIASSGNLYMQYANTEASGSVAPNFLISQKYEVHTYELNKNNAYVDGVHAYEWAQSTFETQSRPLFGAIRGNTSSSLYDSTCIELYELQYWADSSGSMTSHLLPYERISDGVIGFYDHVTNHFLVPLQGAFTSGGYLNVSENADYLYDTRRELLDKTVSVQQEMTDVGKILGIGDDGKVTPIVFENSDDVPAYIKSEVERVCAEVRQHQSPNSLTWISISDLHCLYNSGNPSQTDMAKAAELIRQNLAVDMCMSHGDIIYRMSGYTDYNAGVVEAKDATKIIGRAFGNYPQVRMVGNHDVNCANGSTWFPINELNGYMGAYANVQGYVYGGTGYGYFDIQRTKTRFIILNTSWYYGGTSVGGSTWYSINPDQARWLCTALDMSDKTDAADWGIIIMSHVSIDNSSHDTINRWSGMPEAYINGDVFDNQGVTYDFGGKNAAKLLMYVAGHSHLYRTGVCNNTETAYPLMKVLVPNVLDGREEASDDGVTYTKTPGTAESTSFTVNVLDRRAKVLHSVHYGAGFDRTCHYDATSLTVGGTVTLTSTIGTDWTSDDTDVCTVVGGVVTGVAAGCATIHARNSETADQEVWLVVVE